MKKIIANGKHITIEEFVELFRYGEEYDFDTLGALLDSDTLTAAMDKLTGTYTTTELLEKYLEIALDPIVYDYPEGEEE